MKLTLPMNMQKNARETETEFTCGNTRTSFLNSVLIPLFTCVVLITGGMFPEQASALYSYGHSVDAGNTVWGNAYTAYYLAMMSPNIDNVRIVGFWHRSTSRTLLRAALYNKAGELLSDSGPQVHIGPIDGGSEWEEFSFSQPVDFPRNTPFGYAVKFEHTNGTTNGFFQYTPDGTGHSGDCDQAYQLHISLTSTTPFSPTLETISRRYNTLFYKVAYALYPTISSISPGFLNDEQADILIEGAGFEGKDEFGVGTSKVWLTENNDWAVPGIKVQQPDSSWSNTAIIFSASFGGLAPGTTAYLWVENSDGQINDTSTPVLLNVPCPNPPIEVPGSLSITPGDGSYVPGTFTISDEFTSVETIYGCVYTIDDGTLWKPGVLSGTDPYTCTASDLAATDETPLAIRMKATSCGGTSSPDSLLSRIVDAQGPVSTFTATPGDTKCTLTWPSTDAGSGLHTTEPFELRWGTSAPATCSSGTRLYIGTDTSIVHTGLVNGSTHYYRLCKKDNFGNTSFDSLTCTLNATPWNVLNDGTAPGNGYTTGSATNKSVSTFTLEITNGGGSDTDTITDLFVTGINTANISTAKIYLDGGTAPNTYDTGDTFIASAPFSGNTASFTGLSIPVTETSSQYIITYDVIASPTDGETLTAFVSSASAQTYSVTNNDTVDATLTLDTAAPATTDNLSSPWQNSEITITLTVNDGSGSGVDTVTDLYGCFGTGCTPTVLGGATIATNCGAGNACEYAVRYYSVDRQGNVEPLQTGTNLARVDRVSPQGGTFTAIDGSNPIFLQWNGFTDAGSGISTYVVRKADGATPPADCSSGILRYSGNNTSFSDNSGIVNGQQYSYRLCVYDAAGNVLSDNVATATAGETCTSHISCDSCHGLGVPMTAGGSRVLPPMGHVLHGPECYMCHREGGDFTHVDGIVTIESNSGYMGGDSPWPFGGGGGGMSCGGTWNPIGGDPGGGVMGCHSTGTPNYPGLTPEWECMWEEIPVCNPPPGP